MNYRTFELVSAGCLNLEGLLGAWIQIYRLFASVALEMFASVFLLDFAEQSTGMAHEHRNDVSTCGGIAVYQPSDYQVRPIADRQVGTLLKNGCDLAFSESSVLRSPGGGPNCSEDSRNVGRPRVLRFCKPAGPPGSGLSKRTILKWGGAALRFSQESPDVPFCRTAGRNFGRLLGRRPCM
jgi:hypothetical protein